MNSTKYWIALDRVKGIGAAHMKEIHGAISSAGVSLPEIFELTDEEIKNEFRFKEDIIVAIRSASAIIPSLDDEYQQIIDSGITVTEFFSKQYPERLHAMLGNSIPPLLYSIGNTRLFNRKGAAILGDSNVSGRGEFIAYLAAGELARHDIAVISGFARGTGLTAHRSAFEYGGTTVAYLPYGIMKLNIPDTLKQVYDEERFLAVSCFAPGAAADSYSAMTRNRLICAASYAVFIVESPESGGIFEAAKSAQNLKVPLYAAEYSEYPASASGNRKILAEMGGYPVRGKRTADDLVVPNMDRIIADVKFK